jgi:hypothetical protein
MPALHEELPSTAPEISSTGIAAVFRFEADERIRFQMLVEQFDYGQHKRWGCCPGWNMS